MFNRDLSEALEQIGRGKKVGNNVIIEALESALTSSSKKILGLHREIKVSIDESGAINTFFYKNVVEEVKDPDYEVSVQAAAEKGFADRQAGDVVEFSVPIQEFGRIAAQIVKQVITKKVRDIERDAIFEEFEEKLGEVLNGIVLRKENRSLIVDLGDAEGIVPVKEQVFRENFQIGEKIKVFVKEVNKSAKSQQIMLSRIDSRFIRKLFEMEIPEIGEGKVEIKAIARDPGFKIKIAVISSDRNIDSVGACVGIKGGRIQPVVRELRGEKVDVIEWSNDVSVLIKNAMRPAKVTSITVDEPSNTARVVVPDDHLALAIGKKGQSAKLTAKITGWRIDVIGEAEVAAGGTEAAGQIFTAESDEGLESAELGQPGTGAGGAEFAEEPEGAELLNISGIDEKMQGNLVENGYKSLEDIGTATVSELIKIKGMTRSLAESLLNAARKAEAESGEAQEE
ncbi:MAG: transcription termination factor NusA [Candidatus Firestonebacteria bacterium]